MKDITHYFHLNAKVQETVPAKRDLFDYFQSDKKTKPAEREVTSASSSGKSKKQKRLSSEESKVHKPEKSNGPCVESADEACSKTPPEAEEPKAKKSAKAKRKCKSDKKGAKQKVKPKENGNVSDCEVAKTVDKQVEDSDENFVDSQKENKVDDKPVNVRVSKKRSSTAKKSSKRALQVNDIHSHGSSSDEGTYKKIPNDCDPLPELNSTPCKSEVTSPSTTGKKDAFKFLMSSRKSSTASSNEKAKSADPGDDTSFSDESFVKKPKTKKRQKEKDDRDTTPKASCESEAGEENAVEKVKKRKKKETRVTDSSEKSDDDFQDENPARKSKPKPNIVPDSDTETCSTQDQTLKSPEDVKKRNSIFNYFNKVDRSESMLSLSKIEVKALVHTPPSKKRKRTSTCEEPTPPESKRSVTRSSKRAKSRPSVEDFDKIEVISSEAVTPEKSYGIERENLRFSTHKTPSITKVQSASTQRSSPGQTWQLRVKLLLSEDTATEKDATSSSDSNDFEDSPVKNDETLCKAEDQIKKPSEEDASKDMPPGVIIKGRYILRAALKKPVEVKSIQQKVANVVLKKAKIALKTKKTLKINTVKRLTGDKKRKTEKERLKIGKGSLEKLAPVFLKKKKVKCDPAVLLARKQFLMSGVPEAVKKMLEAQKSLEEQEYALFPSVSHVQQRTENSFWDLPVVDLDMVDVNSVSVLDASLTALAAGEFTECHKHIAAGNSFTLTPNEGYVPSQLRCILTRIKASFPDCPVNRTFRRLLHRKRGIESVDGDNLLEHRDCLDVEHYETWPEKYKPLHSEEVLGNNMKITRLKEWLKAWKKYDDSKKTRRKRSKRKETFSKGRESSGSDFADSDSEDEEKSLPNTAVLVGPLGCGKTSAVYSVANEFGYKVLEINASMKRTGKILLTELQEATLSHQVSASEGTPSLNNFLVKEDSTMSSTTSKGKKQEAFEEQVEQHKMSLILVEDVDVVFEDEDEGFVSALTSLVSSSKRPMVFTTSDSDHPYLSRFVGHNMFLKLKEPSQKLSSCMLQLVCLAEGAWVDKNIVSGILARNKCDIRKAMLQLQYWVLTGGSRSVSVQDDKKDDGGNEKKNVDMDLEELSLDGVRDESGDSSQLPRLHVGLADNLLGIRPATTEDSCHLPYPLDLGSLWFNIHNLLPLSLNFSIRRGTRFPVQRPAQTKSRFAGFLSDIYSDEEEDVSAANQPNEVCEKSPCEKPTEDIKVDNKSESDTEVKVTRTPEERKREQQTMSSLYSLMDNLSTLDLLSGGVGSQNMEPTPPLRKWALKPGMACDETVEEKLYSEYELSARMSHWLGENVIKRCCSKLAAIESEGQSCDSKDMVSVEKDINWFCPSYDDKRWRDKYQEEHISVASYLAPHVQLDTHCLPADYLPALRTICRLEEVRYITNTKRRNRYFHYLKSIGIHANHNTFSALCNVLQDT